MDDHVEHVCNIRRNTHSENTPLELNYEDIAAYDLNDAGGILSEDGDESFLLGGEEAFGCVELGHGPGAGDADDAVLYRNLRNICILLEKSDKNLISKEKEDACWEYHKNRIN